MGIGLKFIYIIFFLASALLSPPSFSGYLVSGDQILDDNLLSVSEPLSEFMPSASLNGFIVYHSKPWPQGVIPVSFHQSVKELPASKKKIQDFFRACEYWGSLGNVKCIPRSNEVSYVEVRSDLEGCNSNIGYEENKKRSISLSELRCWNMNTLYHEIGHTLGLLHEHQRSDRNKYITINWENIIPEDRYSFSIVSTDLEKKAYDYSSIMHYTNLGASRNSKPTIVPVKKYSDKEDLLKFSFSRKPSDLDLKTIADIYGDNPNPKPIQNNEFKTKPYINTGGKYGTYRMPYNPDMHHRY